jgi:hypothetical protein
MTPDLQRLREAAGLNEFIDAIELELVYDPKWEEPSDTSYLTAADRANADIMANVEAMDATNELIAWFGRDQDGFVGLWQGPDRRPLSCCPVVRLDTEGQYELIAATVADYIVVSIEQDSFQEARYALQEAGFRVAESREAIWKALESFDEPNDLRHRLYNLARQRRGLQPID